MQVSAVKIEKFKQLSTADIALSDVTVLIGGNNAGKSSFLQGTHFALTALQSAKSAGGTQPAGTLGFDQFIYKPSNDLTYLHHKAHMTQRVGPTFTFSYSEDHNPSEVQEFSLALKRGKNANISVSFDSSSAFYQRASDRSRPISIFVPGLAGVALKEEKRTDAIVTTGIAQGDSNLYLRNVLLRLLDVQEKLDRFHAIIGEIFPGLEISKNFDETLHSSIEIVVQINDHKQPLELVGTGCLQAMQLVAYVTMYEPALLLLDEPDSHLHPSNQRLLATALLKIAEQSTTKIILATHSRHMFDSLANTPNTGVIWLKDGQIQEKKPNDELSLLLDLGALDSFEMFSAGKAKLIILTEDEKSEKVKRLLAANGFKSGDYYLQTYKGVGNIKAAVVIAEYFLKQGNGTKVIIHRDGDCLLPDERSWLLQKEQTALPAGCTLFVTELTDVEHYFCQPEHLSKVYNITLPEAKALVADVIQANLTRLAMEFSQKRGDLKTNLLRGKDNVPSAIDIATTPMSFAHVKGKSLFGMLNRELPNRQLNPAHMLNMQSDALLVAELKTVAEEVWPIVATAVVPPTTEE